MLLQIVPSFSPLSGGQLGKVPVQYSAWSQGDRDGLHINVLGRTWHWWQQASLRSLFNTSVPFFFFFNPSYSQTAWLTNLQVLTSQQSLSFPPVSHSSPSSLIPLPQVPSRSEWRALCWGSRMACGWAYKSRDRPLLSLPDRQVAIEGSREHTVLIEHGLKRSTDELLVGFMINAPSALHSVSLREQHEAQLSDEQGHDEALQSWIAPFKWMDKACERKIFFFYTKWMSNLMSNNLPFILSFHTTTLAPLSLLFASTGYLLIEETLVPDT